MTPSSNMSSVPNSPRWSPVTPSGEVGPGVPAHSRHRRRRVVRRPRNRKTPRRTSASFSPTCVRLSPAAHRQLTKLPWPGNVAQLRRVLSDTLSRQRFGTITPDVLPPECHALTRRPPPPDDPLRVDARSTHRFGRPAAHPPADQADRAPVHTRCPDLDSPRRG
ncbi:AAA-type ATPase lid domain-containing protein [Nocardia farcinica]